MESKNVEFNLLWLILAVVAEAYVFLFGFLKKINEWAFNSQDPESFINNLVHRYGETGIYKTNLFSSPSIIVCSPELSMKVLKDDERFIFGYPSNWMKLVGKKSLLGAVNSEHKRLRRLISAPITGSEALSMHIGNIEDIVISSLQGLANKNSPVEFLDEMKKTTFKVFTKIFMGSTDYMPESVTKCYADLFKGLTALDINFPGFTFHRSLKARKVLVNYLQAKVNERRAGRTDETNAKDMIDTLLEAEDENGEKLEDEDDVDLVLGLLLGGHETTATAAMWLTIYLHNHPETLQKAKEEQKEIIKRRPSSQKGLTLDEIRQMEYLSKAIDETMRIIRIAFLIFRKAKNDVEIEGYTIPKGWKVLVWHRALHLDPNIYSNPMEFLPSRWENHRVKAGSFIPFGAGSRTCPGANLGKLEISIFLHYFLLNYKLEELNPKGPINYLPLPRPADNCLARIIKLP
ncbi:hypothetical protein PTKIN_Ptkin04bG0224400 [Pterospermum kingtungense]